MMVSLSMQSQMIMIMINWRGSEKNALLDKPNVLSIVFGFGAGKLAQGRRGKGKSRLFFATCKLYAVVARCSRGCVLRSSRSRKSPIRRDCDAPLIYGAKLSTPRQLLSHLRASVRDRMRLLPCRPASEYRIGTLALALPSPGSQGTIPARGSSTWT